MVGILGFSVLLGQRGDQALDHLRRRHGLGWAPPAHESSVAPSATDRRQEDARLRVPAPTAGCLGAGVGSPNGSTWDATAP